MPCLPDLVPLERRGHAFRVGELHDHRPLHMGPLCDHEMHVVVVLDRRLRYDGLDLIGARLHRSKPRGVLTEGVGLVERESGWLRCRSLSGRIERGWKLTSWRRRSESVLTGQRQTPHDDACAATEGGTAASGAASMTTSNTLRTLIGPPGGTSPAGAMICR